MGYPHSVSTFVGLDVAVLDGVQNPVIWELQSGVCELLLVLVQEGDCAYMIWLMINDDTSGAFFYLTT